MLSRILQVVGDSSIGITLALALPRCVILPQALSFLLAADLLLPLHHMTKAGPITQGRACSGASPIRMFINLVLYY